MIIERKASRSVSDGRSVTSSSQASSNILTIRETAGGARPAGTDLRLVHRRLWHGRPAGGEGFTGCTASV